MADIFGKVTNAIAGGTALMDALGLGKKSKKTKQAIKQSPREVMRAARESQQLDVLKYPLDLADQCFVLGFKDYVYQANSKRATPLVGTTNVIALPMPKEIVQEYNVDWVADQVGPYAKPILDAVTNAANGRDLLTGVVDGDVGAANQIGQLAPLGANATGKKIASVLASIGGINQAIALGLGSSENPNDRALLKNVPLRAHTFNWEVSPKNADDLARLKEIYNLIRRNMYPERDLFRLRFPKLVDVGFVNAVDMHFYKTAAIKGFKMDMSQGGVRFFQGPKGDPVTYNITLDIIEMEAITPDDFGE